MLCFAHSSMSSCLSVAHLKENLKPRFHRKSKSRIWIAGKTDKAEKKKTWVKTEKLVWMEIN